MVLGEFGEIHVVEDRNVTMVSLTLAGITVTGSAKRHPTDRNDRQIGRDLALSRAMQKMARRLKRRADGAVKQADHVRAARASRREDLARIADQVEATAAGWDPEAEQPTASADWPVRPKEGPPVIIRYHIPRDRKTERRITELHRVPARWERPPGAIVDEITVGLSHS